MKKSIGWTSLVLSVFALAWAGEPAGVKNTNTPKTAQEASQPSPSPTFAPTEFSGKNTPIPYEQKSTVFKKKSDIPTGANLGLEAYFNQGNYEGREKFYNQLNASIFSSISSKPKALTPEEQLLGTIGTIAGYGMAAGAAAQVLGIIPDGKPKKKK
jgi:hypothetical protein